jgi:hypothetical protein
MSLEFATKDFNGLLLYAGPTAPVEVGQDDVYDFVALELLEGKIFVSVCLGNRDDVLKIGVENGDSLNDSKWHHVEIYRNETVNSHCTFSHIYHGVSHHQMELFTKVLNRKINQITI